jgi:hypothetical protein
LVVDANPVLAAAMSSQGFEPVPWKATQGLQVWGGFQAIKPLFGLPAETFECRDMLALGKFARPLVSIAEDYRKTRGKDALRQA